MTPVDSPCDFAISVNPFEDNFTYVAPSILRDIFHHHEVPTFRPRSPRKHHQTYQMPPQAQHTFVRTNGVNNHHQFNNYPVKTRDLSPMDTTSK
ncbi:hypothetical protein M3Y97_00801500 [Aphelenchoides bicaudatus]|nr:hypothetical protein M3Y97_00801500 [Aphelenchoides bicaudatus]